MSKIFPILACLVVLAACLSEYQVVNETRNNTSITLELQYFGTDEYFLKPTSPIIKRLIFVIKVLTYNDFSFKITDADNKRFEVPQYDPFPVDPYQYFSYPIAMSAIDFTYNANPFDFKIVRRENGAILFSTFNRRLIYSNYYI